MKKGFTLVEILIVVAILSVLVIGLLNVLTAGQNAWYNTDVSVDVQQDLRSATMHLTKELHQSGFKCNNPPSCTSTTVQVTILSGAGPNNTDILRFKVPVDYNQDGYIKNSNGIVETWGANLTWGCSDFSCQKPLGPVETQSNNYQIEYSVDDSRHFLRKVLDNSLNTIRTDIYANDIEVFTASLNGNFVNLSLTARKTSVLGRQMSSSLSAQVLLRNKG